MNKELYKLISDSIAVNRGKYAIPHDTISINDSISILKNDRLYFKNVHDHSSIIVDTNTNKMKIITNGPSINIDVLEINYNDSRPIIWATEYDYPFYNDGTHDLIESVTFIKDRKEMIVDYKYYRIAVKYENVTDYHYCIKMLKIQISQDNYLIIPHFKKNESDCQLFNSDIADIGGDKWSAMVYAGKIDITNGVSTYSLPVLQMNKY